MLFKLYFTTTPETLFNLDLGLQKGMLALGGPKSSRAFTLISQPTTYPKHLLFGHFLWAGRLASQGQARGATFCLQPMSRA